MSSRNIFPKCARSRFRSSCSGPACRKRQSACHGFRSGRNCRTRYVKCSFCLSPSLGRYILPSSSVTPGRTDIHAIYRKNKGVLRAGETNRCGIPTILRACKAPSDSPITRAGRSSSVHEVIWASPHNYIDCPTALQGITTETFSEYGRDSAVPSSSHAMYIQYIGHKCIRFSSRRFRSGLQS